MKRIIYILILITAFASNIELRASDIWKFVNPNPTLYDLNDVKILSDNDLIIVGENGTILKSSNLGKNWVPLLFSKSNTNFNFKSVDIDKDGNGFIVVNNFLYNFNYFNNKIEFIEYDFQSQIFEILVHTQNIIFVLGVNGDFYRSYDGGKNWIDYKKYFEDDNIKMNKIKFFDTKNGIILTDSNIILQSDNAGISWTKNENINKIKNVKNNLKDVIFLSKNEWLLINENGKMFKTFDNAQSFEVFEINIFSKEIFISMDIVTDEKNENNFLILTKNNVYKTKDFIKYDTLLTSYEYEFNNCDFKDNKVVVVGENGTIYLSENYGKDWTFLTNLSINQITDPFTKFVDEQTGYMFELYGKKILKTNDRGKNWNLYLDFENLKIKNVNYFTSKNCLILFTNGTIKVSYDSCKTFNNLDFSLNKELKEFKTLNDNIAILYSNDYHYWTFDGGNSWRKDSIYYFKIISDLKTIYYKELFDFHFIKPNLWERKVYSGKNYLDPNIYYFSQDSGKSWNYNKVTNYPNGTSKIFRIDNSLTYYANASNLLEYRNGVISTRFYPNANEDMLFLDESNGYAIGNNSIYRTTNRGITWFKEFSPFNGNYKNLHLFKDGEILITGSNSIVIKKDNFISSIQNKDNIILNNNPNFLIFPNPSSDKISVDLGGVDGLVEVADLSIYDILGNKIMTIPNYSNKTEIDVSILSIGTYTIQIRTPTDSKSQRLLISR